jgi:hypothetical protein
LVPAFALLQIKFLAPDFVARIGKRVLRQLAVLLAVRKDRRPFSTELWRTMSESRDLRAFVGVGYNLSSFVREKG